jgi:hypothetical protein
LKPVALPVKRFLYSVLFLCFYCPAFGKDISIFIKDAATKSPVPFAAVRFGASGQGVTADMYGVAVLPATLAFPT